MATNNKKCNASSYKRQVYKTVSTLYDGMNALLRLHDPTDSAEAHLFRSFEEFLERQTSMIKVGVRVLRSPPLVVTIFEKFLRLTFPALRSAPVATIVRRHIWIIRTFASGNVRSSLKPFFLDLICEGLSEQQLEWLIAIAVKEITKFMTYQLPIIANMQLKHMSKSQKRRLFT